MWNPHPIHKVTDRSVIFDEDPLPACCLGLRPLAASAHCLVILMRSALLHFVTLQNLIWSCRPVCSSAEEAAVEQVLALHSVKKVSGTPQVWCFVPPSTAEDESSLKVKSVHKSDNKRRRNMMFVVYN